MRTFVHRQKDLRRGGGPMSGAKQTRRSATLLLELVFHTHRNRKVEVELARPGRILGAVVGQNRVGCNSEDPVCGPVQVHVAADDGRRRNLVIVEIHQRGRGALKVLLKIAVNAANQHVGNQRAVLVVGSQPLRAGGEEVLRHNRPLNPPRLNGIRAGAAGAVIGASVPFDGPVLAEPIGAHHVQSAEVGALQQRGAGLHVVIGQANREVKAIVITHPGQRVDDGIGANAGGLTRSALRLGLVLGLSVKRYGGDQGGKGKQRGEETYGRTHHYPAYRTAPTGDNARAGNRIQVSAGRDGSTAPNGRTSAPRSNSGQSLGLRRRTVHSGKPTIVAKAA